MMPELKPCACGGKPKLRRGLPNMGNSKTFWAFVQCLNCGMRTQTIHPNPGDSLYDLTIRAADGWNRMVTHGN